MANNKDFESIIKEITGGLIGESEKDIEYLKNQMEKYKDHEFGKEIIRACGRMMYALIPEDKKDDFEDIYDPDYNDMLRVSFMHKFGRAKLGDLVSLFSGRDFEERSYKEEIAKIVLKN